MEQILMEKINQSFITFVKKPINQFYWFQIIIKSKSSQIMYFGAI